jgi:hypothetical protein
VLKQIAEEWIGKDSGGGGDVNGRDAMNRGRKVRGDADIEFLDDRQ